MLAEGIAVIKKLPPVEGALQQFFFDSNKCTSRHMINGWLMSSGNQAINIPAVRAQEFNEKIVNFYQAKDGTEMMRFLLDCQ